MLFIFHKPIEIITINILIILGEHTNSETNDDSTSTGSETGDESNSEGREEIIVKSDYEFENEPIDDSSIHISKSKSPSPKSDAGSLSSHQSRR